jgi:prepilin peptidase CpaA
MMGGGDVKLAAALALWFSPVMTVNFLVWMSIGGGVLTAVVLLVHRAKKKPGTILIQRFLNQFA